MEGATVDADTQELASGEVVWQPPGPDRDGAQGDGGELREHLLRPPVGADLEHRIDPHIAERLAVLHAPGDRADVHRPEPVAVSYTHLRAHETPEHLVCRLLL